MMIKKQDSREVNFVKKVQKYLNVKMFVFLNGVKDKIAMKSYFIELNKKKIINYI